MNLEPDGTFTCKEIQERFQRLFNRPMTSEERVCFFLPSEANEGGANRMANLTQED
jgi:hypothetical protein